MKDYSHFHEVGRDGQTYCLDIVSIAGKVFMVTICKDGSFLAEDVDLINQCLKGAK